MNHLPPSLELSLTLNTWILWKEKSPVLEWDSILYQSCFRRVKLLAEGENWKKHLQHFISLCACVIVENLTHKQDKIYFLISKVLYWHLVAWKRHKSRVVSGILNSELCLSLFSLIIHCGNKLCMNKHRKSAKLPWHHNIKLSFCLSLAFCTFCLSFCLWLTE